MAYYKGRGSPHMIQIDTGIAYRYRYFFEFYYSYYSRE
jgi:hypothetical protein